ncbi:MAG: DUF2339 domain-containing protein [Sulfitobacter sp.]
MDEILVVVALVLLAVPVTLVALIIGQSGLRKRLSDAEREISKLQKTLREMRAGNGAATPTGAAVQEAAQPAEAEETTAADQSRADLAQSSQAQPAENTPIVTVWPSSSKTPPTISPQEIPSAPRPPSPVAQAFADLGPWLQQNWFYAVSAASLALAGIFLVQYGMENGLLPPRARVAVALAFGAGLIAVGEFIRRRFGDGEQSATAYLPSVFSGAGIVTLFGAILSARMLYDLIGGGAAMVGMVVVAGIAIVLGWLLGPLLVAVGVVGAFSAPVVLENSGADPSPLFGFFAIVTMMGLGVDTVRRWGWISALTLALAYLMGFAVLLDVSSALSWTGQLYFVGIALLAIVIPARSLQPDHDGPTALLGALMRMTLGAKERDVTWPHFPTMLAFLSVAASTTLLLLMWKPGTAEIWLATGLMAALGGLLIFWSHRAPALQDAALIPPLALLASVFMQSDSTRVTYTRFVQTYAENPEASFPWVVTVLLGLGVGISFLAMWRGLRGGQFAVVWGVIAAVYAPAMAMVLELGWKPAAVIGGYPWALHAAGLAVIMAGIAERFARHDGENRLRASFAIMSALSCMAFAFVIIFSSVALTVALAVTVVAAAVLDRMWKLPALSWFIAAGVVTLGYRLVVDPGVAYSSAGPLVGVLVAYLGTLAAFVVALRLLRGMPRPTAQVMLDSAIWSTAGLTISLLLLRWIDNAVGAGYVVTHWSIGLNSAIWLGLALAQMQRTQGRKQALLDKFRWGLAIVFGAIGGLTVLGGLAGGNPLLWGEMTNYVHGPVLINTLAAAYLVPAVVVLAGAWRLTKIDMRLRKALVLSGGFLAAFWVLTVIRHFWQGGAHMELSKGISQPEQYTYTVVLLGLGAGVFYQSLARRSAVIRKAGLVLIGFAVAKVFLVDVTDLDGLTRVFSLLVLGLALAALAWLNRWAQERDGAQQAGPPALPPED